MFRALVPPLGTMGGQDVSTRDYRLGLMLTHGRALLLSNFFESPFKLEDFPAADYSQGERHEPKFIAPHPAHALSFCPLLLSSSGTPFSSTLKKHGARWAAPLAARCGQFALILRAARPSSS